MKRRVGIGVVLLGVAIVGLTLWAWRQGGRLDLPDVILIFTQASWTLPSHMTVMTSQYPSVHCIIDRGLSLPDQATVLAEVPV